MPLSKSNCSNCARRPLPEQACLARQMQIGRYVAAAVAVYCRILPHTLTQLSLLSETLSPENKCTTSSGGNTTPVPAIARRTQIQIFHAPVDCASQLCSAFDGSSGLGLFKSVKSTTDRLVDGLTEHWGLNVTRQKLADAVMIYLCTKHWLTFAFE